MHTPGGGGENKLQRLHGLIIPTQTFQFIDKPEQTIQAHDNAQNRQRRNQYRPPEVAFQ